jgi:tripartite-type tricarboxylate transporter receptor subunit TctC
MVLHRTLVCSALRGAAALMAAFALLANAASAAEAYPSRPGRLIVPFGAGAATDIIARMVAAKFSDHWGQQLAIDNRWET